MSSRKNEPKPAAAAPLQNETEPGYMSLEAGAAATGLDKYAELIDRLESDVSEVVAMHQERAEYVAALESLNAAPP